MYDEKFSFDKQQKIIDDQKEEIKRLKRIERAWLMSLRGRYGWSEETARLAMKQNIDQWGDS